MGGGTGVLSKCLSLNGVICDAPRDFFGYMGSQFFNTSGNGGSFIYTGNITGNINSGKAYANIMTGGGVNNEVLVADKLSEQHFLKGSGSVFGQYFEIAQLAILTYGPAVTGDLNSIALTYRSTGVDKQIEEDDLRKINRLT
jgi:hypothetical protein